MESFKSAASCYKTSGMIGHVGNRKWNVDWDTIARERRSQLYRQLRQMASSARMSGHYERRLPDATL